MAITSANAKPSLPPTNTLGVGGVKADPKTTSTTSVQTSVKDTFEASAKPAPVSLGGVTAAAKTAEPAADLGDDLFPDWGDDGSGVGGASMAGAGGDPSNL